MILEFEELKKIQKDIEEIKNLILSSDHNNKDPEFVTAEKASELLGVTAQTLYNHAKNGLFPKYKFGDRTVYYRLDEIYAAFKSYNRRK
jgi:predicted DNA-binding transcriptional regulator AlpA